MKKTKGLIFLLFFLFSFFSPFFVVKTEEKLIHSAAEIDCPPFCYTDEKGSPTGFSVELLTETLRRVNKNVHFKTGVLADVKKMLENREIDVLPLVARTPEKEEVFDFTIPYIKLHGAIVVRADNNDIRSIDDIEGRTIAVRKADYAEEYLFRKKYKVNLFTFPTFKEALIALAKGEVDAVIIHQLVALRLLEEQDYRHNLKILSEPIKDFYQEFCFAVKKGDKKLLTELNDQLSALFVDGTYNNLYAYWFTRYDFSQRTIIIGGDSNFPPYEFINNEGIADGFNVDVMKEIAKLKGGDIKFHLDEWTNTLKGLKNGEIDLIQGIFYSKERAKYFDFSRPYLTFSYVAVTRRSFNRDIKDLSQLRELQVVVEDDDIAEEYCRNEGLSGNLHFAVNMRDALLQLSAGNYDCAILPITTATYLIEKEKIKNLKINNKALFTLDYCCAVKKGNKALLAEFNDGLKLLEENGILFNLQKKWFVKNIFLENLKYLFIIIFVLLLSLLISFIWIKSLRSAVAKKVAEISFLEKRCKEIFEASRDGVVITDENGKILDANKAYCDMLGYSLAELQKFNSFYEITPKKWHKWEREEIWDKRLIKLGNSGLYEKEYIRKNGEIFPIELHAGAVRNKDGQILYLWGVVRDITSRKAYEKQLHEKLSAEEISSKILFIAISSESLNEFINKSFNFLKGKFAVSRIYLCDVDEKKRQISSIYEWCADGIPSQKDKMRSIEFSEYDSLFSGFGEKSFLAIEDVSTINNEIIRKSFEEQGIKSLLLVKLSFSDRSYSFLGFEESRYRKKWTKHDEDLLSSIANIFTIAIEKFRTREKERLLSVAIENSSEAIVITDPSGIIKYVNKAFERVTGFSGYEAIGRTPSILKSGEHDENFYKNLWNHLINKKTWEGHFINKRKDGTKYHEEALISPVLDEKGEIINYVAIKRDITERLNLEKQLQSAQKLEAIGRIAGGVAHDFNNMLSVIIGFAELAREKVAEHPVAKDIDEIIKAGKKSSQLTRQLLIFSRRDISKPEFIKLNKFIDENLNMLRKTLSKNISFLFTASERELTVKIDPSQLTQVLMNICINAKDAIGEEKDGKVEIAVRPFDVSKDSDKNIHTFNERFYARISISDNGCGMEPEILANIFEPFFTTKPKEYGTGLGLSTVYGIVKQNNGFITVDTSSGKGSTFNIYLPLVQENGASSHISTPISMKEEEERKRILVVEDDPSILAICTSILKKENYEVLSFSNTREALRTIKGEKKIDLLLTDVVMPDMNGKELAEEVLKTFPTCKVLYMSGYTSDIILTKGIIEEETNFIRKPFTRNELIEQILKILR